MRLTRNQAIVALRIAAFSAVVVAFLGSGCAFAQSSGDPLPPSYSFAVTYFDNNGVSSAPDAYIHVVNPDSDNDDYYADVYVWRSDQELSECCTCRVTFNAVLTFTVATATANPGDGNPTPPTSGSIDIITDEQGNPTDPKILSPFPAWATHVGVDSATGAFDVTETPFSRTTLSDGQLSELTSRCGFIFTNGSGHGQCFAICGSAATDVRPKISR